MYFFTGSYSINVFPEPLSSEEEEIYLEKLKNGDKDARAKLIEHNLRLVAHIVKKYDSKENNTDDLISIGTIGLIKGIDSFKHDKNIKLTTYCAKCIENEVLMFFRSNNKYSKDISMNEVIGYDKDGAEISIIDVIKESSPDFIERLELKENISLLNKYLDVLSPREKEIIIRRYGLFNKPCETQRVISKKLNISRSYVSRIEKKALDKILGEFIKNKKY